MRFDSLDNFAHSVNPSIFHQIYIGWSYLAVKQGDNVVVVQLGQLLQDLDLLAQQVLALGQVLLRDRLDGHHIAWCLEQQVSGGIQIEDEGR